MPQAARYVAHTDSGHCHILEARSFEDAALHFAEAHAPWTYKHEVRVTVQSEGGGAEHCFLVHLHGEPIEGFA